jgi:hypothetical protein
MKRFLVPVLGLLVLLALGLGARWAFSRPVSYPPQEADRPSFLVQATGAGESIEYRHSEIPIRSLIWSRPLPGGALVAQLLTQSNRQQALLFTDGKLDATLTLVRPPEVSENVFNFAELEDAALIPGQVLLLLYRTSVAGELPVLIAWNLQKGGIQWVYRGAGSRLALSPEGQSAFLYGPGAPVQILALRGRDGVLVPTPGAKKVDLPSDMAGPTDLLPTGPIDFLATEEAGLAAWKDGTWIRTPAPTPSPLGFSAPRGALARTDHTLWWQPEPGHLVQVAVDASIVASQDLTGLVQGAHERDMALLHLLGADPQGFLWFAPVAPGFKTPLSSDPMAIPVLEQPVAPVPDPVPPQVPPSPASASPAAPATVPPAPSPQEVWDPYLKAGLGRLYRWKPGSPGMQAFDWASAWKQLGAPSYLDVPTGDGGLIPASGGFLLGGQERRWWLPLGSVPLVQPR